MKFRLFYPILFLAFTLMMPACSDSDDGNDGNDTLPEEALPSDEFVLNTLPDEPYAEDAIRIENNNYDSNAPFYSLELMGDGYYLLTKSPSATPYYAGEAGTNGKRPLFKGRTIRTRGTRNENGDIETPEGLVYGRFTKLPGEKKYRLSDGSEIDLQNAIGSNKSMTYKGLDGRVSTVYVNAFKRAVTNATKSICHSWECNELELWLYLNELYIAHGKMAFSDGEIETYYKAAPEVGLTEDEFFNDFANPVDEYCYKIVFTCTNENGDGGTYLCFYLDGDLQVTNWQWEDERQGTLRWYDEYEEEDAGYCTVRFDGNQMRVYEDYTYEEEEDEKLRLVAVSTLTRLAE